MSTGPKRPEFSLKDLELIAACRKAAPAIITKHLSAPINQISGYNRTEIAFALLMMAHDFLCQYLSPEKAQETFDTMAFFAKRKDSAIFPRLGAPLRASPEELRRRIEPGEKSAREILARYFGGVGPQILAAGRNRTEAAYALSVLAYDALCQVNNAEHAELIFDALTPYSQEHIEQWRKKTLLLRLN